MTSGWLMAVFVLAAAAALAIRFAVRLRRRLDRFESACLGRFQAIETTLEKLHWDVETAAGACRRLERTLDALPSAAPAKPGLNVSRRFQALRLYRRGERPEQIAAALGVPVREVELLIKVHQITMDA
jgi:hypothetical protein